MNFDHTLSVTCRLCNKEHLIICCKSDLDKWQNREGHIQDILHYLSADQRELLISGTCGECFDGLFPPDDDEDE